MVQKAKTPCRHIGCRHLVDTPGYCELHKSEATGWNSPRWSGSRHERGYGSKWTEIRKRILARDNGLCQPCLKQQRSTRAKHVDHIIRKADGGSDRDDNLQSICVACHRTKTATEGRGRPGGTEETGFF
ncbi:MULTISPECIES: HNH endonuclease [unclassified Herbaspirillum]|uniref:HNH endonuclease n=1 Tax=unclassified Herbaspirillum TaxID=2624150 RepID=UPI000E2F54FD|nr:MULTISPECIES: HNH endonuclease [unclassified Herbaspirillum]RFB74328.1 HNH endonuclease [Herbaspirillum sp. 3R-3a1]TFI10356.1 HNH endonuclease [Herbaspirillum sp. 3R11]TFI16260.1 HNH endonuclease [Herbaspirillum sp. 3R-11]TFI28357.1 HNH endonuclease [Herbaspirillum sp. 3C11]